MIIRCTASTVSRLVFTCTGARRTLKDIVERSLVASGLPHAARILVRSSTAILAYHNILPEGVEPAGDQSLHLPRATFAAQLDLLSQTHNIISLDELVMGQATSSEESRPQAVVTFDDAYRGAVTVGLEELRRRGLPCTVFVTPGRLGDQSFWWDEIGEAVGHLEGSTRSRLFQKFAGRQDAIRTWMVNQLIEPSSLAGPFRTVSKNELTQAVASGSVTIGSHSWSHPHLPALAETAEQEARKELVESLSWLASHFPNNFRPWLAYPYGATSNEIKMLAGASGYQYAVGTSGGLCKQDILIRRPWDLPRVNIPSGLTLRGFILRTVGL